ncbi:DUF6185 family protein [Streptomyces agglomeratus]|uniref:DUF6185 family protein n=1 Tax=Streptomyces agglomeratus TaxID=285458 RepID=UPI00314079C2
MALAVPTDPCRPDQLAEATVRASLTFRHRGSDFSKLSSSLVVTVPTKWAMAPALSLAPNTEAYRSAMRCLLDSNEDSMWWVRGQEWRTTAPAVTSDAGRLRVEYRAHTWADHHGRTDVGPWNLDFGADNWRVRLTPPAALSRALWSEVSVDLDGQAPQWVTPPPGEIDKGKMLRWRDEQSQSWPHLAFAAPLPQHRNAAAGRYPWVLLEGFAWDIAVAGLMLVAARRLQRAATSDRCRKAAWGLQAAAWIAFLLALQGVLVRPGYMMVQEFVDHPVVDHYQDRVVWLVVSLTGLALIAFGRPRRSITWAAFAAAVLSALPVLWPPWFGLPWKFQNADFWPERIGSLWLAAAAAALVFLWLLGVAAALQRIAAASWGRSNDHRMRLHGIGFGLAVVSVTAGIWSLIAAYRFWERLSWLSSTKFENPQGVTYDEGVTDELIDFLVWFGLDWATLVWTANWVISAVALLFALRARALATGASPFAPPKQDRLLILLFFPVAVAPAYGWYAGVPATVLSLLLNLAAVTLLLHLGVRHARLTREVAANTGLNELLTPQDRSHFLQAAGRHRELHAQLRRLEKGQHDEEVLNRASIERMLDRLHRWRVSPFIARPAGLPSRVRLPQSVSPIDVVLCWGPHTSWWDNARETARTAGWLGVPATCVMFWAWSIKDGSWAIVMEQRVGLLAAMYHAGSWQITWMAGGFLLGALWRILPGRQGPTKALFVTLAIAAPVLVHLGLVAMTGQARGVADLGCALLLLVLTITGIRIDVVSFTHERPYWRSPIDLLLSVYQMRHVSVQVAYLLAQVAVVLAIWSQVTSGPDPSQMPHDKSP